MAAQISEYTSAGIHEDFSIDLKLSAYSPYPVLMQEPAPRRLIRPFSAVLFSIIFSYLFFSYIAKVLIFSYLCHIINTYYENNKVGIYRLWRGH